mgnify:CR=1 FL=1
MPLFNWPAVLPETRATVITLPLLSLGAREQVIAWAVAMPDANYSVQYSFELGAASIGGLVCSIKPGTQTAAGVTLNLSNTLLVSIAAGAKLHVTATQLTE